MVAWYVGRLDGKPTLRATKLRPRWAPANSKTYGHVGVLAEDAVVLYDLDSGFPGMSHRFMVDHPILQPQILDSQADHGVYDRGNVLRRAKYIHEVDTAVASGQGCGLSRIQVGIA